MGLVILLTWRVAVIEVRWVVGGPLQGWCALGHRLYVVRVANLKGFKNRSWAWGSMVITTKHQTETFQGARIDGVHGRMGMKRVILQKIWYLLCHPWFADIASAQLQTCW